MELTMIRDMIEISALFAFVAFVAFIALAMGG